MDVAFAYKPEKLEIALNSIRRIHPSYSEFVDEDHGENVTGLMKWLSRLEEEELPDYCSALGRGTIDYLVLALALCDSETIYRKIEWILTSRFRKKYFEMAWAMLQNHDENRYLSRCVFRLAERLSEKFPRNYPASLFYKLKSGSLGYDDPLESLPVRIHTLLLSEEIEIDVFFMKYAISAQSVLASKVCTLFFLNCPKEGFLRNRILFARLLNSLEVSLASSVAAAYLFGLEVLEYFDEVNTALLEKFGEPGDSRADNGAFWGSLSPAVCQKFHAWLRLKRMEHYFGEGSMKFGVWTPLCGKIREVGFLEREQLLFIDFGTFVVVDSKQELSEHLPEGFWEGTCSDSNISYIYKKEYFDTQMNLYATANREKEGNGRWRIMAAHAAEARDLVIEGKVSDIYRVEYAKIQLLYLKETIKILLNENN